MRCQGAGVPGCVGALMLALPLVVHAQSSEAPAPQPHHLSISAGLVWLGSYQLGDTNAALRSNAQGSSPAPFTLFDATTKMASAPGFEGRVGLAITRSWSIEAGGSYATPDLVSTITHDEEHAGTVRVSEKTEQFTADVSAMWRTPVHVGGRLRPYLTAGGGYLRQLHQDRGLLETGRFYYAGGGGEWWLRGGHGRGKTVGIRGELRRAWRRGGIGVTEGVKGFPELLVLSVFGVP